MQQIFVSSAMNPCIPDWNFEGDIPISNQMKPMGSVPSIKLHQFRRSMSAFVVSLIFFFLIIYRQDNELVELLWQNGHVVLSSQAQTQRKPSLNHNEPRQVQKQTLRGSGSCGNSSNLIQDDETVSWIHCPIEDSFEKDFYSHLFSELPPSGPMEVDKHTRQLRDEKMVKFDPPGAVTSSQHPNVNHSVVPELQRNAMPPPRFEVHDASQQNKILGDLGKVVNFSQSTAPPKGELGPCSGQFDRKRSGNLTQGEVRECSMMTVGSSHCGSNQVAYDLDMSRASSSGVGTTGLSPGKLNDDARKVISPSERGKTETIEPTVTSSSGGSGSSFNRTSKQSTGDNSLKRKSRDAVDSECQSEVIIYLFFLFTPSIFFCIALFNLF